MACMHTRTTYHEDPMLQEHRLPRARAGRPAAAAAPRDPLQAQDVPVRRRHLHAHMQQANQGTGAKHLLFPFFVFPHGALVHHARESAIMSRSERRSSKGRRRTRTWCSSQGYPSGATARAQGPPPALPPPPPPPWYDGKRCTTPRAAPTATATTTRCRDSSNASATAAAEEGRRPAERRPAAGTTTIMLPCGGRRWIGRARAVSY